MLSSEKIKLIKSFIQNDARFINRINESLTYSGKERGHSNASPMEDVIREIIIEKMAGNDTKKDRALADVILDGNLINVKFGSPKKNKSGNYKYGQPNMCAMNRIIDLFYKKDKIDSYYIIKVNLSSHGSSQYSLHVFDMLDYIDYLVWNSGTGQIMLKESEFYRDVDNFIPNFTIEEKKKKIKALYDEGMEKHILLRVQQYLNKTDKAIEFKEKLNKYINHL